MGPGDYNGGTANRDPGYMTHPPEANYRPDFEPPAGTPSPSWHNGAYQNLPTRPPQSPALSASDLDADSRRSGERNRSRPRNGRSASGQTRICKKCGEQLTGQFVRALDGTFHLDCFRCRDCGEIVASKFFPADDDNGEGQYPLCETDYFRRLDLLCHQCGGALRGSYITALDRKYHVDHFTCSLCSTIFGAQDSYYEHDGEVYCHYHYSTQFAQRCSGCQTAILKQFVEIYRNGQNQHWHPECYMIHKFWNVRLSQPHDISAPSQSQDDTLTRDIVREEEERMEEKVFRIWSVLSTFEESSASCISDMLLHVSNGAYVDGVLVAKRFIFHVEILFQSADRLDILITQHNSQMRDAAGSSEERAHYRQGLSYGREAKLLCKKIVAFFSLLSKTQDTTSRKLGVTQELLSLVTGLAHYLKLLIRICLQGALKVEKEYKSSDGLYQFLDDLNNLESLRSDENSLLATNGMTRLASNDSDQCILCRKPIEDECVMNGDKRWHISCVKCARCGKELGRSLQEARLNPFDQKTLCSSCYVQPADRQVAFERVSKLQQYIFLLKVALARLLEILRSNGVIPHSSDGVTVNGQESVDGRRSSTDMAPPYLNNDARSKSYAADQNERHQRESSYESTLNDVRRLRSTRLDKHLSSSFRKARASRVMDGDNPAGTGDGYQGPMDGATIDEATTESMLGHENALTLDDIPRIVAAEQAAQRPHAYKQVRQELYRSPATEPAMGSAQQRSRSVGRDDPRLLGEPSPQRGGTSRKYFSELSGLEYFIVRRIAVMTMHPMVESEFSLDELLSFVESGKPATFWNKFAKPFSKNDGKKAFKKKGVFGVPLELIIERDGAESTDGVGPGALRIPAIVDDLISSMRKMDLSVEGVFRKNGNIKKLTELAERIDREGCDSITWTDYPVVQLAALLKRYLRDLPDPLMTHKLYKLWLAVAKIQDDDKRRHCLHLACCLLPKCHRDCLEILFSFLKWAGSFHQVDEESGSKMDIKNLSTVIAPNILYSNSKIAGLDMEPMYAVNAVEDLITFNEEMCLVPDDLVDLLNDPTLFSGSGDISTKEILKRLGDRAINGPSRPFQHNHEVIGRHDSSIRPLAKRVDTDPNVWQQESSVRPIQAPSLPPGPPYGNSNLPHHGTPPQKWRNPDDTAYPSPYNQQFEDDDEGPPPEGGEGGQRKEWRNSGWRQNNSNSLGVTGVL